MVADVLGLRRVAVMVSVVESSDSVRWMTGLLLESVTDRVTSATLVAVWAAVGSTLDGRADQASAPATTARVASESSHNLRPPPPVSYVK